MSEASTTELLVDAYRAAGSARLKLDGTARWRRRRRLIVDSRLRAYCAAADKLRRELGAPADAPGLYELLERDVVKAAGAILRILAPR